MKNKNRLTLTRDGKEYRLTQEAFDQMKPMMDKDITEYLDWKYSSCDPAVYLEEYLECDLEFADLLYSKFEITIN